MIAQRDAELGHPRAEYFARLAAEAALLKLARAFYDRATHIDVVDVIGCLGCTKEGTELAQALEVLEKP